MSYIPIVPHVPVPEPSPRARRLAVELETAIDRFEEEQGRVEDQEIRQALRIVERSTAGPACASSARARLVMIGAVLFGTAVAGLVFARSGLPALGAFPMVAVVMGLIAVGAVVAAVAASRR